MGIDYVDVFYSHRFDPDTPLEETMMALDSAVRSGRALYAGISSYEPTQTRHASAILRELKTPLVLHQPSYSMFNRWVENGLLDVLEQEGVGCIVFSPLAQGLLTDRYLNGVPPQSRASRGGSLQTSMLTERTLVRIRALSEIAAGRAQSLAEMAIAWVLRKPVITSALIGASRWSQVAQCLAALKNLEFSPEELAAIDQYAVDSDINIWKT
jgi:L-glyceraldehyde 3-phosphate reductase